MDDYKDSHLVAPQFLGPDTDYSKIPLIEADPDSKIDLFEARINALKFGLEKAPELSRPERELLEKLHGIKDIKAYLREEFEKYPVDKTYL